MGKLTGTIQAIARSGCLKIDETWYDVTDAVKGYRKKVGIKAKDEVEIEVEEKDRGNNLITRINRVGGDGNKGKTSTKTETASKPSTAKKTGYSDDRTDIILRQVAMKVAGESVSALQAEVTDTETLVSMMKTIASGVYEWMVRGE